MFVQRVTRGEQNPVHDIFRMPASLYIRLACTADVARAAFGQETCEVFELFGAIKDALAGPGYRVAANGAQEVKCATTASGWHLPMCRWKKITP